MKRERGSSIERVLDIIETVADSTKPLSATEINEVLNLPKATAHRLCAELEARGYLLKRIDGKAIRPAIDFLMSRSASWPTHVLVQRATPS